MKAIYLVYWFRQLAVLQACGIPLVASLEVVGRQSASPRLGEISRELIGHLRRGLKLSAAMAELGPPFAPVHLGAVQVGEYQGDLAVIFERLADHEEAQNRLRQRLLSALTYPLLVLGLSGLGLYLLVRLLAPVLANLSAQLEGTPSLSLQILTGLGRLLERDGLVLALLLGMALLARALATRLWVHRRHSLERLAMAVPLVGKMFHRSLLVRSCRTLETMLRAGLPLTEALRLAGVGSGCMLFDQQVFAEAERRVRQGESLAQALQGRPWLPRSFTGMVVAGQESGSLEVVFGKLSSLYEIELQTAVESFLAALEPLAIAVVGSVVLGVLLGAFLPLYQLVAVL